MNVFAVLLTLVSVVCAQKFQLVSNDDDVSWTLENRNGSVSVPAQVPGGVYSDLHNGGVIGDILAGFNDVLTRWVSYDTWTYTAKFNVTNRQAHLRVINLVLDGVDTVAFVELNDVPIGTTDNMFVRYVFDVKKQLKSGKNELKITFVSPVEAARLRSEKHFTAPACVPEVYNGECHANQIRKMQASFSWDWGPAFPSVGIWKPIYIEFYNDALIRYISTHIKKIDTMWKLRARLHLESGQESYHINGLLRGSLQVEGMQTLTKWMAVNVTTRADGTAEIDMYMLISQNAVREWWPNGYGEQPLYDFNVHLWTDGNTGEDSHKHMKIGFRTLEVVEENASLVLGNTTSGGIGKTFYFKINGYPLFMKGSNWIPASILPELGSERRTVDTLLMAACNAHMAMLRVWGGGVYESDYFYEKCDELGILIWQDFLFACSMYPADSELLSSVKTEIEQNVLRLQYHPSIAIWAGNNENEVALRGNWYGTAPEFEKYKTDYIKLYVDTIKPIVEDLDPGRRYLVSSPSNGLESEDEDYIAQNPYDPHYGDTHYYNYLADNWDMNIYPKTRFASEYGFQSLPSLTTMRSATNKIEDFDVHSNYSIHRQHSPNGYSFIQTQLSKHLKLSANDTKYFEKFVYYSQISQAMAMKAETEFYRQSQVDWYTMGALYWQLNDVWQAPSWSGIEYGGKWKMLHYFAKLFFAPVLVSPRLDLSGEIEVYLLNDRFVPINNGQITVDVYNWSSLEPISTHTFSASVGPLNAKKQDISLDYWSKYDQFETFLTFTLRVPGVMTPPLNYVFPKPLKDVVGLKEPNIRIIVSEDVQTKPDKKLEYTIEIQTDSVVLFLWLETNQLGHFEDNGLLLVKPQRHVIFSTKVYVPAKKLQKTIKYQYYVN